MKWIMLIGVTFLLSSCCCTSTRVVQYRQVSVVPVMEPVMVEYTDPIDVTTTTIDFY